MQLHIPDDVTIPQFMFEGVHPFRPEEDARIPWLIDGSSGKQYFADEVKERTTCIAIALRAQYSIEEGDIVGLISGNHIDFPLVCWAAQKLGAAVFASNPAFGVEELVSQLEVIRPRLIFTQGTCLPTVKEAAVKAGVSTHPIFTFGTVDDAEKLTTVQDLVDYGMQHLNCGLFTEQRLAKGEGKTKIAVYMNSSGTTGVPKMIGLSHYSFIANIIQAAAHDVRNGSSRRYRPGDVSSAVLPLFHMLGLLINLHHPIFCGMSVVVMSKFSFKDYRDTINKYNITHLLMVPPMATLLSQRLHKGESELKSLRLIAIAGSFLNYSVVQELSSILPNTVIGQIYGMTECAAITGPSFNYQVAPSRVSPSGVTTTSIGSLLPGVSAKVVKEDGTVAHYGEAGELWVQTPALASTYFGRDESFTNSLIEGWLPTGDEVYFDEKNELHLVQRLKDLIKVKGFQVSPVELEAHLQQHPFVEDCCVIPMPHAFNGEVPLAYVVLTPDARDTVVVNPSAANEMVSTLMKYVSDHKVSYKHLGGVEFCNSIPKTATGKLLRRVLRLKAGQA